MSLTDFHTHVLPCLDDGSRSVRQSVEMLRLEAEQGVRRVVATPHFYPNHDNPSHFLKRRAEARDSLLEAMQEDSSLPTLCTGAEIHFFEGISDCEYLRAMAIEGTDAVMVEMPMKPWSERNINELVGIYQKQRLTPILAHIDRYLHLSSARELLGHLSDSPLMIQANADAFFGLGGHRMMRLLSEKKVHLLGTDCHNTSSRPPNLGRAIRLIEKRHPHALSRIQAREEALFSKQPT